MVSRNCDKALSKAKRVCNQDDRFACSRAVKIANESCGASQYLHDRGTPDHADELHGKCRRLTALSRDFDVAAGDFCVFKNNRGERVLTVEKIWLNEANVSDKDFLRY